VQRGRGAEVQMCKECAMCNEQRCRGAEVQWCRGAGAPMQMQMQM